MMRKANVYFKEKIAGIITETTEGYEFQYNNSYINSPGKINPISLTLPIRHEIYYSPILFPFFDGLIPEGWLLNIAVNNWKIAARDRFGLLITLCNDCIGAVSIIPIEINNE
ncbi:phosphatidylinositol kinase [Arachidicoccus ginsenosidivorans]|uniref:Phosphatidylinositol kinase n=2 Tax=Arachidicoccus ginsenosidivorans TaxID=496057 RepID=A0A5B8VNI8_9BACT|nr:phosphatidylinositol kinase [Arachidicoccus ginsenosidivorans]